MTQTRSLRPDARLVQLHAERGDPATRLAEALAALEEADWGLLFSGELALARQLVALLGPGTLRVDGRLSVDRSALAQAGLAVADLHGDLSGARAVWLLEPDEAVLERARRAGVRVIVDGTLAPGGAWPQRGADYVVYRDGVTLTGHADAPVAALFGMGRPPEAAAPAPSDLSVALALRDVATLPLRLARAARTVANLSERLGGTARAACPTALLLPPDAAADTAWPLGGVLGATRHVPEGVMLTPGLEDTDRVLALLRNVPTAPQQEAAAEVLSERPEDGAAGENSERGPRDRDRRPSEEVQRAAGQQFQRRDREDRRFERQPNRQRRFDQFRPEPSRNDQRRPEQARPDEPRADHLRGEHLSSTPEAQRSLPTPQAPALERFTFEAPQPSTQAEEIWEPEIVFSDLAHAAPPLTHTVSSGPDAPEEVPPIPDVAALADPHTEPETGATPPEAAPQLQPQPSSEKLGSRPAAPEVALPDIVPDLPATPAGKEDPAANLTDEQAAIYARLRDWRNAEAKRQEISRFIIASNASLAEIARRVPYTLEDLAAVKGMGKGRLEKYGQKILEVVKG
ncbi:HRDC domain-containing protein [Deinococcus sp.]|uniref:HRDC domain-containing protein n=1 Tax=Deinococcus sp. TaxID=47478 RepID=UPI0025C4A874|nr:HRDC domain-containing protein [Deinococcus sp.]